MAYTTSVPAFELGPNVPEGIVTMEQLGLKLPDGRIIWSHVNNPSYSSVSVKGALVYLADTRDSETSGFISYLKRYSAQMHDMGAVNFELPVRVKRTIQVLVHETTELKAKEAELPAAGSGL